MTAEMWVIIGTGVGVVGVIGLFFRILNVRIDDLRTDLASVETRLNDKIDDVDKRLNDKIDDVDKRLNDNMDGVETHLNDKIDGVETRLNDKIDGVETRLNDKIDGVENRLTVRMDAHDHRFDIADERLRAVERGQGEVIGAVNMMQTIVVETLNREIDSQRAVEVNAD